MSSTEILQVPLERPTGKAPFRLHLPWELAGDQPRAAAGLLEGLARGDKQQTLLGTTGSGKTVTMAKIIAESGRPALVLAHNKTLAAQLYGEFKEFFPENNAEYFVSYYDYYQPEAYIARTDTYIEKDSSKNEEIDRMRHAATRALFERRDVIIVASVSCIYGLGAPVDYGAVTVRLVKGQRQRRDTVLRHLVDIQYERNDIAFTRGTFRVRGDTLEIHPAYEELAVRIEFFGDEVERITELDPLTGEVLAERERVDIYPARHFVTPRDKLFAAVADIEVELQARLEELEGRGRLLEAQRLKQRTNFDLEMLRETGTCAGVENYSRIMSRRPAGSRPWTLLDYFPPDFLTFVDESHISLPQVRGMYGGDRARKEILVEYGFRLPSALDNRPLTFKEFEERLDQVIFVSATPGPYELEHSKQIVQQIIRPTGLVDPEIEIRPTKGQIDDLLAEIRMRVERGQRSLVTTLTKKMAEDLTDYLREIGIKVQYLHSEVETIERVEILRDLRLGVYDVVVGVNLLREGIDLPEVTLVAILDADKEGYLRSEGSLIQVIGRASRHVEGRVIMYADRRTVSMDRAIAETDRRRAIQVAYNTEHGIEPQTIVKAIREVSLRLRQVADAEGTYERHGRAIAEGGVPKDELARLVKDLELQMKTAAKELQFEKAAALRDEIVELRGLLSLTEGPAAELGRIRFTARAQAQREVPLMLFAIVIGVAILGGVLLAAALFFQKGREGVDLTPRSLLRVYLYVASLAGIVVLAGGMASLVAFGMSAPMGRDAIYGSVPIYREVPCPVGAVDCKQSTNFEEQTKRAVEERDRRAAEDLIRGITFSTLGAIFFGAHWIARKTLGFDEPRSMLLRGYLMLGTVAFGLATIIMLPSGITTAATNALVPSTPDTYRQGAGEALGGGVVALVVWLIYLRLVVRDFRHAA